jgi:hypothetical protein
MVLTVFETFFDQKNTMKKIILTYGLIAGTILGIMFFITVPLHRNGTINFDNGMLVGYTTMVIALSLVFFGVKSYRDNYHGGTITFGQAFKVGGLIALIACVMYCLTWEIAYNTVSAGYMEAYGVYEQEKLKSNGASEAELQEAAKEFQKLLEVYDGNPFIRFAFTIMEILPVALVVSLISAALLKRKDFLPSTESV